MSTTTAIDAQVASKRKRILIVLDWFLPGFRGGGPITSIANFVAALGESYDFSIITSDRDYGQKEPYPGITPDCWLAHGPHCQVWYCSTEAHSYRHFRRLIAETEYDLLYLNSMFSLTYTIFPLWNSRSIKPEVPVLLAPRGMLHAGALSLKPLKKKIFLKAMRLIGIAEQIAFQATDTQEVLDIQKVFGDKTKIFQAPNLPKVTQAPLQLIPKQTGALRLIFLSRITAKKGLHILLECLRTQAAQITLDIIGPDQEAGYWQRCAAIIAQLPTHIKVQKHEPMPPEEALEHLRAAHAFAMPTLGENFGHAIFEALSVGRPVLISDQTPWRDLAARQLGHDIPTQDVASYSAAIAQFAAMPQAEWEIWAQASYAFAAAYIAGSGLVEENLSMLEGAIEAGKIES